MKLAIRNSNYMLFHDDALRWLEKCAPTRFSAVVTDPPFSMIEFRPEQLAQRENGKGGIWRLPYAADGIIRSPTPRFTVLRPRDHDEIEKFHGELAAQLLRVLVPGAHTFIASQSLIVHRVVAAHTFVGFEYRGQICRVVKTLRGGDRPKFSHVEFADMSVIPRSSWEPWLIFRKPCVGLVRDNMRRYGTGALRRPGVNTPFRDLIFSGVAARAERAIAPHPSLKPQAFLRQIVRAALPVEIGAVLDPFAGSGSTLAAAEYLGLSSVGIERDKRYFEMASVAIDQLAMIEGDPDDR